MHILQLMAWMMSEEDHGIVPELAGWWAFRTLRDEGDAHKMRETLTHNQEAVDMLRY